MKIKILEYKLHRGPTVRVQSHNKINGKWIENQRYAWHKKVANGETYIMHEVYIIKKKRLKENNGKETNFKPRNLCIYR